MKTNGVMYRVGRTVVSVAVNDAVTKAGALDDVYQAINRRVGRAMRRTMYGAMVGAVYDDPQHLSLADFLAGADQDTT